MTFPRDGKVIQLSPGNRLKGYKGGTARMSGSLLQVTFPDAQ